MTDELTREDLVSRLVDYADYDITDFGTIVKWVREHPEVCGEGGKREAALWIAEKALDRGVFAGEFSRETKQIVPWDLSPKDAVARMDREWAALDHDDPIGGEVAWFTLHPGALH